ncbi:hypothetical protein P0Y43_26065 [Pseudomonas entomophila]|uniref:hypothetical protein n=1 Tax=Pseudomonas entomophila TaxID=312306 RepID=UPI0023D7EC67|nr:hypothetical protein [Pseudomonas entomophila]MDF0734155.1 hypothetical protein [Pseudomonas entomophila]
MKKHVPDPPRLTLVTNPLFTTPVDMIPPDALAHASELLRGVTQIIDEYCRENAGEPRVAMLTTAAHSAAMSRALVEHALTRI